ncbi:helix-turn-helix domain-containing protein [Psychroserpens jangbogonensis]|uniref:helix-turn-helix domain-containing protein n=1 Tax=Psychroserpens jangbogonensis TaxID=1484460 RepID=UPI00068B2026|nr:helix-turn-helix domain-containing protein [Psychroserpens jangbogonensis]
MQPEIGSLYNYPYINYKNCKTKAFHIESVSSASLIWIAKGSLKCSINNQVTVIPSNTIILLDKGNVFSYKSNSRSQIKILEFNTEIFLNSVTFICGFINNNTKKDLKNHIMLFFKNEQSPLLTDTFSIVEELITGNHLVDIEKLSFTICNLLQNALIEKSVQDSKYINRFGELLNSQYNIFHNVSDYASQLIMKPKNLLRLFQKNELKNPSEIIKEKLLLESKKRLVYTDESIREICFEIGFSDPAYFSRFFKKHTSLTPQHFRKEYAQN